MVSCGQLWSDVEGGGADVVRGASISVDLVIRARRCLLEVSPRGDSR